MPLLSIERRVVNPQPTVFVRCSTSRDGLAQKIGEGLGQSFAYAQSAGLTPTGRPFVRYTAMDAGGLTIEAGTPLTNAGTSGATVQAGELPGGPVVVALHGGHYQELRDTYTAVERWMAEQGLRPAGAPWESYITDPEATPDPADWRTEIYWPVAG